MSAPTDASPSRRQTSARRTSSTSTRSREPPPGPITFVALSNCSNGPAGIDLAISSEVPRGAGLSSSAALEVAVGRALSDLPGPELAVLAQRAENEFVGVQCGIMDQFASANARAGHALLLDCRDLTYRHIPIPPEVVIVVCDSRMERRLAVSGYSDRREACEAAARRLGIRALRDAKLEDVETLPALLRRRARHVVGGTTGRSPQRPASSREATSRPSAF